MGSNLTLTHRLCIRYFIQKMEQRREGENSKWQVQKSIPKRDPNFSDPLCEQNSLPSLGSLPDASLVMNHFQNDDDSFQRMTISSVGPSNVRAEKTSVKQKHLPKRVIRRHECPHCKRQFVNSWAIPKHVSVRTEVFTLSIWQLSEETPDKHKPC